MGDKVKLSTRSRLYPKLSLIKLEKEEKLSMSRKLNIEVMKSIKVLKPKKNKHMRINTSRLSSISINLSNHSLHNAKNKLISTPSPNMSRISRPRNCSFTTSTPPNPIKSPKERSTQSHSSTPQKNPT